MMYYWIIVFMQVGLFMWVFASFQQYIFIAYIYRMGQNSLIIQKPSIGLGPEESLTQFRTMKNQKKIELSSGRWDRLNLDEAIKNIMEWKVEFLLLNQNFNSSILPKISGIYFSKIKYLSLAQNQINSMEMVSQIRFPCLEYLVLSKNFSCDMRSIRKIDCPNLLYLNISYNLAPDLSSLSEMHIPKLQELKFEDLGQKRRCENLNWITRIEAKDMKRIVCLSAKRIRQDRTRNKLVSKYPSVQLKMLQTSSYMDLTRFPFQVFDSI